jgi:hypothetical protein
VEISTDDESSATRYSVLTAFVVSIIVSLHNDEVLV